MNALFGYRSILLTTLVAGVFSLLVCALLVIDGANRLEKIPMEETAFVELRQQLVEQPGNEQLREQIRAMDLALRQEYFREQRFTEIGSYLLLGGIVVTLVFGKWAATLRRRLPCPKPKLPGPDSDERLSHSGPWAVAVVILALIGTALVMNTKNQSVLPASLEELASLREQPSEDSAPTEKIATAPALPKLPELPSEEDFQTNWPSFRGPQGAGVWAGQNIPSEWDGESGEGVLWKTAIPLPGVNSPILWKDRVFLSGASEESRQVYCVDVADGNVLWNTAIEFEPFANHPEFKTTEDVGYAAPTMATDGRFVFAMFADGQLVALDFSGNEVWKRSLGVPQRNNYGHASSLATHQGAVIVQYDQGASDDQLAKLISIDGASGETHWEIIRETSASWSSPIVIRHDDSYQIITCCDPWVIAYAPSDGKEIWRAKCLDRVEVGPSPIYSDGVVYAGNDMAVYAAIRADGTGDVTETHILWEADYGLSDTCSPVATEQYVLTLASYGTLFCFDKKEGGEPLWEEDFAADFVTSLSLVGGQVFLISKEGTAWIVKPTQDGCERIAEMQLGEECVTCPAFQDGRMIIRGREHLFCIGSANRDE